MYDAVIIGAGVTGCAIARELSFYQINVLVLERASDVCEGTSKANSGIVHAGYDALPGSLKAKLNVRGNEMMEGLSEELDFPFRRNGSLVLCFDNTEIISLEKLKEQGTENGVKGLRIIYAEELQRLEPNVSKKAAAALYAPTGGIVCPFGLTIALGENAAVNGAEFCFNTEVLSVAGKEGYYCLETTGGMVESRLVINAAGVYADVFHNMICEKPIRIMARKGEYCLLDKAAGSYTRHTLFQLPGSYGKGVLVTPTVHGNLLVGPSAEDIPDKEGVNTTGAGLEKILETAGKSVVGLPAKKIITSFAGLRAHEEKGDFIIGEAEGARGFIDVAGIESPGLTCAPAIGSYVAEMAQGILGAARKQHIIRKRKGIFNMAEASDEERRAMIQIDSRYANVICRCEMVTEGEIVDAIHRPLGAATLDGVKRRTRAGMGRCQAGFCSPRTVDILARELSMEPENITKAGGKSNFIIRRDDDK